MEKVRMNLATKLRMEKSNPYIHYKTELEKLKKTKDDKSNDFKENCAPNSSTSILFELKPKIKSDLIRPATAGPTKIDTKNSGKDRKSKPINFIERNKKMLKEKKIPQVNMSKANQSDLKIMTVPQIKISSPTNIDKNVASLKSVPKLRKSISADNINELNKRSTVLVRRKSIERIKTFKKPDVKNINSRQTLFKKETKITKNILGNNKQKENKKSFETRRTLSAVHFKRIKTNDMNSFKHKSKNNCEDEVQRLKNWLEKKGRLITNYHHIHCFGSHLLPYLKDYNEENKENFDGVMEKKNESYENLHIEKDDDVAMCKADIKDLFKIANDALHDLHKLILEGYPREYCEAWLDLIKSKFSQVEDEPQYWECRAALEETCKNFSTAIECYQQAIKKGAELKNIDESLDHLLKKFQVLNLSPKAAPITTDVSNTLNNKSRRKTLVEARNIFKSSIINFAVKEKITEEAEKSFQFFATPVRRSTRLSRTAKYTSTPGVKLCSTLDELEESQRDSIYFKSNKALF